MQGESVGSGIRPSHWLMCQATNPLPRVVPPNHLLWQDAPPPRLESDLVRRLRTAYTTNYPSEPLTLECTPREQYFATVYDMRQPGRHLVYKPWTQIVALKQAEELREARGDHRASVEIQTFFQLMW